MKTAPLDLVLVTSATALLSCPAEGRISQASIPSSFIVPTATTSTLLPAQNTKMSTVSLSSVRSIVPEC
jgi:hypothetical protein